MDHRLQQRRGLALPPLDRAVHLVPGFRPGRRRRGWGRPDGSIWFTQTTKGNIAKLDNAGVITEGKVVKGSGPFGITVAPNGDPWYTMMAANKIATLQLR